MSTAAPLQTLAAMPPPLSNSTHTRLLVQRKCACGSATSSLTGECEECKAKKALQTKLTIGESNGPLEHEADRVADQVMTASPHHKVGGAAFPRIQRLTGQATGRANVVPASVDRVLASPGMPLEPTLREDMEQRFGHDFSQVRIHHGGAAAQSTRDVQARAFTAGRDVVFGASQSGPLTAEGARLLAHELTHVVQQGAAEPGGAAAGTSTLQRQKEGGKGGLLDEIEDFGKGLVKEAEQEVRKYLRALGALPGTGARYVPKRKCPANFCDPFADVSEAKQNLVQTAPLLLTGIAKVVSPSVVPLWAQYLLGGAAPQNLTSSFAADFTASPTTAKTAKFIREQMTKEIKANHKAIMGSAAAVTVNLTPRMGKTLAAIDSDTPGAPHAMVFTGIGSIPGNIAGGIGKDQLTSKIGSKPSPFNDKRTAAITATLTRTTKGVKVKPGITFLLRDTIDLCPGDCGAETEWDATVLLSRFEATDLCGDVPYEIAFPAPPTTLGEFEIPVAKPVPAKPQGSSKPKAPEKPGKGKPKPKSGKTTGLTDSASSQHQYALGDIDDSGGDFEVIAQDLAAPAFAVEDEEMG